MQLIDTVAKKDYIGFFPKNSTDTPNYQAVSDFLKIDKKEASLMAGVSQKSVRYDTRIPVPLAERFEQVANIVNRVAGLFDGDMNKTGLWFRTPNPLLGEVSPRDMLRMDRYKRLSKFVGEAERSQ